MAWNRASETPKVAPKKSPSAMHGIVAGLVVVCALGGLCLWMFSGGDDAPKAKAAKERGLIKEVTPAAAPTNAVPRKPKFPGAPLDWDKPYPPQAYWPDGSLKQHSRYVKVITNKMTRARMSIEEVCFKNIAERDIASALTMRPGDPIFGERKFGPSFVKSFLRSLNEEVVIDPEKDTPAQQELKQAVIEAKKDLKQRYDAGEDIAEIMNETRKQFKELALYTDEIKKMVRDVKRQRKGELTEADEHDLIAAANKMLEDRGCMPLKLPGAFVEQAESIVNREDRTPSKGDPNE